MGLTQILRNSVVALAALGVALPNAGMALAANPVSGVKDVALEQGGALRGQVISAQGVVLPGTRVSFLQNGRRVVEVSTDKQGRFVATGLSGGIYVVAAQGTGKLVRAWTAAAAPPAAAQGLLFVPLGDVTNGQQYQKGDGHRHGGGGHGDGGYGDGGFGLGSMGFGALVIGAAITAVVVLATTDNDAS